MPVIYTSTQIENNTSADNSNCSKRGDTVGFTLEKQELKMPSDYFEDTL